MQKIPKSNTRNKQINSNLGCEIFFIDIVDKKVLNLKLNKE